MKPEIIITEDGSNSLYVSSLNENYHSGFGAINESLHVFVRSGFDKVVENRKGLNILEVGFGTGLNALLTLKESIRHGVIIRYDGIEPYPLSSDIFSKLNYPDLINIESCTFIFKMMHESLSDLDIKIGNDFLLHKIKKVFANVNLKPDFYHLVYFDAFAPDVQPELWELPVFQKLFNAMSSNGVLVTYSAKGQVRRNMQQAGFKVERIPGPKGKRERLRAIKELKG